MIDDPEVTIEPADNGYIVKHYQKSTKKDESGRTIRRVASTAEEALGHAGRVLGSKVSKKRSSRDGHAGSGSSDAVGESGPSSSPVAHFGGKAPRGASRRRRPRVGGRR